MNLYDQLLELQSIEDAFEKWKDYRLDITGYILSNSQTRGTLALFGAGRCNDIDLKLLEAHFDRIVLLDKDAVSMKEALIRYKLETSKAFEIKQIDFLGLTSEDYRQYADALVKEVRKKGIETNLNDLAQKAIKQLEILQRKVEQNLKNLELPSYEHVVVLGVHSQLFSILEWIWHIILQILNQDEGCVRAYIDEMNDKFIIKFNDILFKAARNHLIIGCETCRLGRVGAIQGALQAINDLEYKMEEGFVKTINSRVFLWPFNKAQNITYEMLVYNLYVNTKMYL